MLPSAVASSTTEIRKQFRFWAATYIYFLFYTAQDFSKEKMSHAGSPPIRLRRPSDNAYGAQQYQQIAIFLKQQWPTSPDHSVKLFRIIALAYSTTAIQEFTSRKANTIWQKVPDMFHLNSSTSLSTSQHCSCSCHTSTKKISMHRTKGDIS